MPEFYKGSNCRYQLKAQPYLDAIARELRVSPAARAFLLAKTEYEKIYAGAELLWKKQWDARDPKRTMICPFWSNYFYDRVCESCDCRTVVNSRPMEIDALFFLRRVDGKTLAIHIEMKRDREPLKTGQAEAYRPRAVCYQEQRRVREGVLAHDHFLTVLFYGIGTDIQTMKIYFEKLISHECARKIFPKYPTGLIS